jgi:hypothetical protein
MRRILLVFLTAQLVLPAAWGWGAPVHRTITYLALDGLPPDGPAWLQDPAVRHRIAFQSNQVDRWRGWRSIYLKHENDPDHYLDSELLDEFGLTLETVPKLRREYVRALVMAKHLHPEKVSPYDPTRDSARVHEWPGFILHAVAEEYAKLQAAFFQVRILETLNDPARRHQVEQARAVVIDHLGNLAHFVADAAQPLHTTKHFDGWEGDNPAGFVWREHFHAYIDDGWAETHHIDYFTLKPHVEYGARVDAADPWDDVIAYFRRSHGQVTRLYELERDGKLDGAEGRELIVERFADATAMLSAMVWAAYSSAVPNEEQIESWVSYNGFDPRQLPPDKPTATEPAASDR